jgi:hypothetical protein
VAGDVQPDSTVQYTVKELLDEQTDLLRGIDRKVDGKADKADLIPILSRLDDHHGRIGRLEDERASDKTAADVRATYRRRLWMAVTAIVVPLGTALIIVLVH